MEAFWTLDLRLCHTGGDRRYRPLELLALALVFFYNTDLPTKTARYPRRCHLWHVKERRVPSHSMGEYDSLLHRDRNNEIHVEDQHFFIAHGDARTSRIQNSRVESCAGLKLFPCTDCRTTLWSAWVRVSARPSLARVTERRLHHLHPIIIKMVIVDGSTGEQDATRLFTVLSELMEETNKHRSYTAGLHAHASGIKVRLSLRPFHPLSNDEEK